MLHTVCGHSHRSTVSLLELFLLACEQCVHRRIQLIAAFEEVEFENENISNCRAAEFLHQ